ncbi:hypothetical protein DACRYDRAFT_113349 [Dacryopinax primogenitus]|uniref:Transcription factor domain-containing protein n=1 Tax=Dacryopinax primogenitus (strain DJM 731) TaxID=1858805 RepID=M5G8V2_DACPD|nr:uncharacterized protein DACRYDRAFT_113349 [Dacryopinax primogenitus]EJU05159.1 hypothetical protein DACRYDRAFT_113349 [Dacryopinax primogenitus]
MEDAYHCQIAAVLPGFQNRRLFAALTLPVMSRAFAEGRGVFGEASSEENVSKYAHTGAKQRINALRADQGSQAQHQPRQQHEQDPARPPRDVVPGYRTTPGLGAGTAPTPVAQGTPPGYAWVDTAQFSRLGQSGLFIHQPLTGFPTAAPTVFPTQDAQAADQLPAEADSSFASFLESPFSSLPPEVSATYRLPNVDTFLPDTFFDRPFDAAAPLGPVGEMGIGGMPGGMLGGFSGLGFLHPSPPSWGGSNSSSPLVLPTQPNITTQPSQSSLRSSQPLLTPVSQRSPPPVQTATPIPSPLSDSILIPHIALFFERLHPIMPIFTRSWLFSRLDRSEHHQDPQFAAMLLSMSALALTQPVQASEPSLPEKRAQAGHLLEESCRMRSSALFAQHASIDMVLTSFYVFACLFGMKEDNAAWFRLTEAVTLGQLLKLHVPGSYEGLEKGERERRLRTYWILCITERAYALQRGHGITFRGRPSQDMGAIASKLQVGELDDFPVRHLKLFDSVDEDFIDCWNGRCAGRTCTTLDVARALALHKQLSESLDSADTSNQESFEVLSSLTSAWKRGEIQSADVLITQQWLLNRLWRLCMSHGLISPSASEPALRVDLPVTIAHAALAICNKLSMTSIEAHGIGYLEKLYDIAATLAVLNQYAPEVVSRLTEDGLSVSQLLAEYVALFRRFRGGDHPFMGKLLEAIGHLLPP